MDETISAAEANRAFSRILRDVQAGRAYVVTVHGRAVARIVPMSGEEAAREAARDALLARLRAQPAHDAGLWRRNDLYDDLG
jgi:prevent-host-death family protein